MKPCKTISVVILDCKQYICIFIHASGSQMQNDNLKCNSFALIGGGFFLFCRLAVFEGAEVHVC